MVAINQVTTGAAFIARHMAANPRELVAQIIEQYEGCSKEEQFAQFRALIANGAC